MCPRGLRKNTMRGQNGIIRPTASRLAAAFLAAALPCASPASAATILSKADLRLWQTVHDRAAPLEWAWEDGADAAALTFSNRVTRAVSRVTVARGDGDARGSCAQPTLGSDEAVFDVTLAQTASGSEIARESATLAYVHGAGGGPLTLRPMHPPERELARLQKPRVHAFDPTWLGEAGDSGYDVAWPAHTGLKLFLR